ncbi:hypothetical protein LP109_01055 [Moraxella bovis]|uniref:hypothetical protein n=1 Tax=Moraxella bovis TaxID=476 RepID=UPI00099350C3|nr:hypothetical protein [Moraxella bovis]OOR87407.1 hypothetical protein B0182_12560 [Moraxella bovis]UZA16950.1 hypothetical protein LP109_01055 [Moraxella bovis]
MNWQQWKAKYHKELEHIAGYEEKFVDLVLMKIPNLQPTDVIPQYHFKDSTGKNRYVDFMVINQHKNWLLPIELDGYAKMVGNGNDYERFQDFLSRQNDIIKIFGKVFRFSNKDFLTKSKEVINTINSNISVTSFDWFWFNFKITNIQNNPLIQNKFIHYDFVDTVLRPFSLTVNHVSYGMVNDYYIIIEENSSSPDIKIHLDGVKCCITGGYIPFPIENFYEEKEDIFTILTAKLANFNQPQIPAITDSSSEPKQEVTKFVYQDLNRRKLLVTWQDWYKYYDIEENHFFVENFLKKIDPKANLFFLKHSDDNIIVIHYRHVASNSIIALVICADDSIKHYKGLDADLCIRLTEDEIYSNNRNTLSKVNKTINENKKQIKKSKQPVKEKNQKSFINKLLLPFKLIKSLFKIMGNILTATGLVVEYATTETTKWVVTTLLEQIEDAKSPQEKAKLQKELQEYIAKENLSDEFIESCKPKKDNTIYITSDNQSGYIPSRSRRGRRRY